jgi:hypothetical protein
MQLPSFSAKDPCTLPPQKVPAIAQQARPPFFPEFSPLAFNVIGAGHTPNSVTFAPPGSRPHFLNSQQFSFDTVCPLISFGGEWSHFTHSIPTEWLTQ